MGGCVTSNPQAENKLNSHSNQKKQTVSINPTATIPDSHQVPKREQNIESHELIKDQELRKMSQVVFRQFDKDKKGYLNPEESRKLAQAIYSPTHSKQPAREAEINQMIKDMDLNQDGVLEEQEVHYSLKKIAMGN